MATISTPYRQQMIDHSNRHVLDEEDTVDHIILAVDKNNRGTVGCAYYTAAQRTLYVMEDAVQATHEVIESLCIETEPTVLLASSRINDSGLDYSRRTEFRDASLIHNADGSLPLPYHLNVRPISDFRYEAAVHKIVSLAPHAISKMEYLVPGEEMNQLDSSDIHCTSFTTQTGKWLLVSGMINLDNKLSIGCAGAIIAYLQRKRSAEYLADDPDSQLAYRVERMEMFNLVGTMLVNVDTLIALQIIKPESHPNAANQGPGASGSKESLSVYGLFQHLARTPQGKIQLRKLFLRPSLDIGVIRSRHNVVSLFIRPENQMQSKELSKNLSKIKNMRSVMTMLRKGLEGGIRNAGRIKSVAWLSLLDFCYHCLEIVETIKLIEGAMELSLCTKVTTSLKTNRLQNLGTIILHKVDLEDSADQHRTIIKPKVDDHLDQLKTTYNGMDEMLTSTAMRIINTLPNTINISLNVIYLPQLGFIVNIPLNHCMENQYFDESLGWKRIFTAGDQAYFKNEDMFQLDEEWCDLYAKIGDIEIEISHELAQNVLQEEEMLIQASDVCGELDCLLALAHGAKDYSLVRPALVEENIIDVTGGRHLLQELTVTSFVPNDILLAGGGDTNEDCSIPNENGSGQRRIPSIILLTGPNYSGKSVYQKQVALIAYMAQVGSFVSAKSAVLGITDKLLTRITNRETVSRSQSAFMTDLQQISIALNSFTNRTLLIIDEFGKGTDPCDGAGLVAGLLRYLISLEHQSPKVLISTHFHEIFSDSSLDLPSHLEFAHMEVRLVSGKLQDKSQEEVIYLYSLCKGQSNLSYGIQCASLNNIPDPIIQRAISLANHVASGKDLVTICSSASYFEAEVLQTADAVARRFIAMDLEVKTFDDEAVRSVLRKVLNQT